jgi:hypothetical protein
VTNILNIHCVTLLTSDLAPASLNEYYLLYPQDIFTFYASPGSSLLPKYILHDSKLPMSLKHFATLRTRAARDKRENQHVQYKHNFYKTTLLTLDRLANLYFYC